MPSSLITASAVGSGVGSGVGVISGVGVGVGAGVADGAGVTSAVGVGVGAGAGFFLHPYPVSRLNDNAAASSFFHCFIYAIPLSAVQILINGS